MSEIFKLNDLTVQCGYYELSIQICPTVYKEPIKLYVDYFSKLKNVTIETQEEYFLMGKIHFEANALPFQFYVSTHVDEIGIDYFWISLFFKPEDIEHIFGAEYEVWALEPKVPQVIDVFLENLAYQLFQFYSFKFALIGFEVRKVYSVNSLHHKLLDDCFAKCYTSIDHYEYIHQDNHKWVTLWLNNYVKPERRILTEVVWCFSQSIHESIQEFEEEIITYNQQVDANEKTWQSDELAINSTEIGIVFNHWINQETMDYSFIHLKAENGVFFTYLDLLFQLQFNLKDIDLGENVFFEGLQLIQKENSSSLPTYLLKCGS